MSYINLFARPQPISDSSEKAVSLRKKKNLKLLFEKIKKLDSGQKMRIDTSLIDNSYIQKLESINSKVDF